MKMNHITTVAVLCCLALSSCYSTLKVKVDVLDKAAMEQSFEFKQYQTLREQQEALAKSNPAILQQKKEAALAEVRKQLTSYGSIATNTLNTAITGIDTKLQADITSIATNSTTLQSATDNTAKATSTQSIKSALAAFNSKLNGIANDLKQLGLTETQIQSLNTAVQTQVAAIDKTTYGGNLVADDMASFVAKAPEYMWSRYKNDVNTAKDIDNISVSEKDKKRIKAKSRFNTTTIKTWYGNADIAIVMDQPGYFVIKGVKLDATKAITSTFKVLGQGIKYLAASYGVAVPQSSSTNPSVLNVHAQLKNQLRELNTKRQLMDTAGNSLLNKLESVLVRVTTPGLTPEQIKALIQEAKQAMQVYKQTN